MNKPSKADSPGGRSTTSSIASSTTSRWSSASRTVGTTKPYRSEPHWAQKSGAPSLYIGPWQEFALGRALKHQHQRRRPPAAAPESQTASNTSTASASSTATAAAATAASAHPPGDLTQFVTAFKEMAENLDEEAAQNLLAWSPLFLPTVEGLMRGGDPGTRGPKSRIRAPLPKEVRNPAPHPRAQAAAAERLEHLAKMRQMYAAGMSGGEPAATCGSASSVAPPRDSCVSGGSAPPPPATVAPPASAAGADDDFLEDEVDDLLQWTTDLPPIDAL